jgi:hypothetical protein
MKTKYIICAFLLTSLMIGCGSTKTIINPNDKLLGNWNLVAEDTPQGDVPIIMTITKSEAGIFAGSFNSIMGNFQMSNLILKDGAISCNFYVQGIPFEFKGVFTNDEFKGKTSGQGQDYVTNGKKTTD